MFRIHKILGVALVILIYGCSGNKWDVDISNIKIDQDFKRFDLELFSINQDKVWDYVPQFESEYGNFFDLYNKAIINIGGTNQMDYDEKLVYFLTDPYISEAFIAAQTIFQNINIDKDIHDAFCRYNYYFPEKGIPDIYTHVSGFNQSIVVDSAFISISLDKYLGKDSKFYKMLRSPVYLRNNMYPSKIPADVIYSWGITEFPYNNETDNLLSEMIYYGKMHVFMDAMLPQTTDSVKWGYSAKKMEWCKKNERQMWLYLVENKLLFNSSVKEIKRFINDGPFTTPFSKLSPPRTGRWLGYQIVNAYLKRNPEITLPQLMEIDDYQKILNESKYRP